MYSNTGSTSRHKDNAVICFEKSRYCKIHTVKKKIYIYKVDGGRVSGVFFSWRFRMKGKGLGESGPWTYSTEVEVFPGFLQVFEDAETDRCNHERSYPFHTTCNI